MAIYRRFDGSAFTPADQARMGAAYEVLLTRLNLKLRDDPLTELLATRIIEAFESGERDAHSICRFVLARIGIAPTEKDRQPPAD
jgi:hypothetical protein